jgi:STE24 endopeptidase
MNARRWRFPAASVAALLIAVGTVVALRPDPGPEPLDVPASRVFAPAELERGRDYAGGQRLLALGGIAAQLVVLVLLVVRPPRRTIERVERVVRGRAVPATALVGAGLILAASLAALPFAAIAHERAVDFGKSTQSWLEWGFDQVTSTAIALAVAAVLAALFAALMRWFPRGWWIGGAGVAVGFAAVFVWLAPVVLDPVFNDYRELPAGRARDDVEQLARRAGVDVGEVLVVDASRRTTAANAYVGGLGHTKRVVLYDTLLERFTPDQVRLVIAHELGHVKHRDLERGLLWLAIVAPGAMLIVMLLTRRWSARAGVRPGSAGSLPAFALALSLVVVATTIVSNQLSRPVEAAADAYSLELTGAPREFIAMERRLVRVNLSDPEPPQLYSFLFGTHPTVMERIGAALAFERVSGGAGSAGGGAGAPR